MTHDDTTTDILARLQAQDDITYALRNDLHEIARRNHRDPRNQEHVRAFRRGEARYGREVAARRQLTEELMEHDAGAWIEFRDASLDRQRIAFESERATQALAHTH